MGHHPFQQGQSQCTYTMRIWVVLLLLLAVQAAGKLQFNEYLSFRETALDNSFACTDLCPAGRGVVDSLMKSKPPKSVLMGNLSESESKTYFTDMLTSGLIVPIVFAGLTFLGCIGFSLGRACCNSCGGRVATESYRKATQTRVRIILVFWCICIIILFALIIATNHSASRGIDYTVERTDDLITHFQGLRNQLGSMGQPIVEHTASMAKMSSLFEALPEASSATSYKQCLDNTLPKVNSQSKIANSLQEIHASVSALESSSKASMHLGSFSKARDFFPTTTAQGLVNAFTNLETATIEIKTNRAEFSSSGSLSAFSNKAGIISGKVQQADETMSHYVSMQTEVGQFANYIEYVRIRESTLTFENVISTLKQESASPMTCIDVRDQLNKIKMIFQATQNPVILQAKELSFFSKFKESTAPEANDFSLRIAELKNDVDELVSQASSNLKQALQKLIALECSNCDSNLPQNSVAYTETKLPNLAVFRNEMNAVPVNAKIDIGKFSNSLSALSPSPDSRAVSAKVEIDDMLSDASNYDIQCLITTLSQITSDTNLPIGLPTSLSTLKDIHPYAKGQADTQVSPTGPQTLLDRLSKILTSLEDINQGLKVDKLQSIVDHIEEVYSQFELAGRFNDIDAFIELTRDVTGRIASLSPSALSQQIDRISIVSTSNELGDLESKLQVLINEWTTNSPNSLYFDILSYRVSYLDSYKFLVPNIDSILSKLPESCTSNHFQDVDLHDVDMISPLSFGEQAQITSVGNFFSAILSPLIDLEAHKQTIGTLLSSVKPFAQSSSLPPRFSKDSSSPVLSNVVEEYSTRVSLLLDNLDELMVKVNSYKTSLPAIATAFDGIPDLSVVSKAISAAITQEVDPSSPAAGSQTSLIYTPLHSGYSVLIPFSFESDKINAAKAHVDVLQNLKQNIPPSTFSVDQNVITGMTQTLEDALDKFSGWLSLYRSGRKTLVQQGLPFDEQRLLLTDIIMLITLFFVFGTIFLVIKTKHKPMMFFAMILFTICLFVFLLSALHLTLGAGAEGMCKDTNYTISTFVGDSQIEASTLSGFLTFLGLSTNQNLVASDFSMYQLKCQGSTPDFVQQLKSISDTPPAFILKVGLDGFSDILDQTLTGEATRTAALNAEISGSNARAQALMNGGVALGTGLSCETSSPYFRSAVDDGFCGEVSGALSLLGCLLFMLGLCIWPGIVLHICAFKRFNRSNIIADPGSEDDYDSDSEDEEDEESNSRKKGAKKHAGADNLLANAQPAPYVNVVPIAHGFELSQLKGFKKRGTSELVLQSPVVRFIKPSSIPAQEASAPPQKGEHTQPGRNRSMQPKQ